MTDRRQWIMRLVDQFLHRKQRQQTVCISDQSYFHLRVLSLTVQKVSESHGGWVITALGTNHRVHDHAFVESQRLKILEKKERGCIQVLPKFLEYTLQISGKVAVG